jgi:alpha-L-arabinofuranosidase
MKTLSTLAGFLVVAVTADCSCRALPPVQGEEAVFDISKQVVVANPPRFGVNISPPAMNHWDTEPWHNQWWLFPNPNPVTARVKGVATGGSSTTLENQSGLGFYDIFRDGFFDGGRAAIYRFAHNEVTLVRESKIATFQASVQGPNRVTFDAPGPVVKAGDFYVLTTTRTNFPATVTRTLASSPWLLCSGLRLPEGDARKLYDAGVRISFSPDVPPHGGGASLSLQIPQGWTTNSPRISLGNWLISGERDDFPRFHQGKTYTLRLWMKQQGMPGGAVDVKIGSMANPEFKVGTEWREYTADFIGAPPKSVWAEPFEIHTAEPGTLLIDNITLVEKEGPPPYGFYPKIVETLKRFQPSSLRIWVLQANNGFGKALDDALGPPEESNLTFQETEGARTTTPLGLHQMLELCEQVGADPWIITSTMFSVQEQKNLIEYLAGPPDSPYGKKRAEWGHRAPWTETFHQIKLEMGNETWNGMFVPQGFPGRGDQYGAYSEFMFRQMKASPWFHADKFQFVLNGWGAQAGQESWAFGAAALRNAPSAQAIDIAYYTGGWDAVGLMKSDNAEEGWMNVLTYSRRLLVPLALKFKETADAIAARQGRPGAIQCLVYEAGPGYTLPGPGKLNLKEQQEGKSLGQAINSLDSFMNNLRNGYGDQAFFALKNGNYWASHNRQWGEHIIWKALAMRNSLLPGDLISATSASMVTMDLPETKADVVSQSNSSDKNVKSFPAVPKLPLIDCYPFRSGTHYSIMLISRRLDAPTKVTLNLPYQPESRYTQYILTGKSPEVNNIDAESVAVTTQEKEGMKRSFSLEIPPHSVIVLTNEAE